MKRFAPGTITATQADELNRMMDRLEKLERMGVSLPLTIARPAGIPQISLSSFSTSWKEPVRVATTTTLPAATYNSNGTIVGNSNGALSAQDGVTLVVGDAILVKDEPLQLCQGIYRVAQVGTSATPFILARRDDADSGDELLGATVAVLEGASNADTVWLGTANAPITVGTTALPWVRIGSSASTWKTPPVRAATTTTLPTCTYANGTVGVGATLTGNSNGALSAQDGVTLVANDDLLVKNQSTAFQNGIYTLTQVGTASTPFILTRRTDTDSPSELLGATVAVSEGTTNADTVWLCTANATITVGTTSLPWVLIGPTPSSSTVTAWKEPVRAATLVNGTLASAYENGDSIDGVTLATGDRILLLFQTTGSENGIYTVNASGAPTLVAATVTGDTARVINGSVWNGTAWTCWDASTGNWHELSGKFPLSVTVGTPTTITATAPGTNVTGFSITTAAPGVWYVTCAVNYEMQTTSGTAFLQALLVDDLGNAITDIVTLAFGPVNTLIHGTSLLAGYITKAAAGSVKLQAWRSGSTYTSCVISPSVTTSTMTAIRMGT